MNLLFKGSLPVCLSLVLGVESRDPVCLVSVLPESDSTVPVFSTVVPLTL